MNGGEYLQCMRGVINLGIGDRYTKIVVSLIGEIDLMTLREGDFDIMI